MALNTTIAASTWKSTSELWFGQHVCVPLDALFEPDTCTNAASESFASDLQRVLVAARAHLVQAQAVQKWYFDKHHRDVEFDVG